MCSVEVAPGVRCVFLISRCEVLGGLNIYSVQKAALNVLLIDWTGLQAKVLGELKG